ncbi:MAG: hypothetical protein LBM75_02225 [Myxococcales bacterium]|jgi:ABC-type Na+ efflux pump permease subunit|nr:hypothetical protein [Myxococcales bacterium]
MHCSKLFSAGLLGIFILSLTACSGDSTAALSEKMGAAAAGNAVGAIMGAGKGVATSIDKAMQLQLESHASLAANGLTITYGKNREPGLNKASVYLTVSKAFNGTIQAKALDENGNEIGRAQKEISMEADSASYLDFKFPDQMDSAMVRKINVSVRAPATPTPATLAAE